MIIVVIWSAKGKEKKQGNKHSSWFLELCLKGL